MVNIEVPYKTEKEIKPSLVHKKKTLIPFTYI